MCQFRDDNSKSMMHHTEICAVACREALFSHLDLEFVDLYRDGLLNPTSAIGVRTHGTMYDSVLSFINSVAHLKRLLTATKEWPTFCCPPF